MLSHKFGIQSLSFIFIILARFARWQIPVIYAGFFGWGVHQKCMGSDFQGLEQNFTIGRKPKIYGNLSKICVIIIKNRKIIDKILGKIAIFWTHILFFARHEGKIRRIIPRRNIGGLRRWAELPEVENVKKYIEIVRVQLQKFNHLSKMWRNFCTDLV